MTSKDERLQIRCSGGTKVDFKEFAAGYDTQAEAIRDALEVWEDRPELFDRDDSDDEPTGLSYA